MLKALNNEIRSYLTSQVETVGGTYEDFEPSLLNAIEIYNKQPLEFSKSLNPHLLGTDTYAAFLGLLSDQLGFLEAISLTLSLKLGELAIGIVDNLNNYRLRTAVVCARTLYEEAAAALYYLTDIKVSMKKMMVIPPSTFRPKHLTHIAKTDEDRFKELLSSIRTVNYTLRKWSFARKIDIRKDNFYQDHKLDKKDPLYQGFPLSSFKNLLWEGKPAELYYALLCEATHPNAGANGIYIDISSVNDDIVTNEIRKEAKSNEVYWYTFDFVCRPTIESIRIIINCLETIRSIRNEIGFFRQKIQFCS